MPLGLFALDIVSCFCPQREAARLRTAPILPFSILTLVSWLLSSLPSQLVFQTPGRCVHLKFEDFSKLKRLFGIWFLIALLKRMPCHVICGKLKSGFNKNFLSFMLYKRKKNTDLESRYLLLCLAHCCRKERSYIMWGDNA